MSRKDFAPIGAIIEKMISGDWLSGKQDDKYQTYMRSPEWWEKRRKVIERAMSRCERCQRISPDGRGLEVHHKTYKHLGDEPLSDLEVLCPPCHVQADAEREARTNAR